LQLVLDELAKVEMEIFEKEYADLNWYKGKQQKEIAAMEAARSRGQLGELCGN
jgi:5'-3' exoribonuclease 1